ncbi:MAG: PAS domain-containing protein [Prevotella sp.]|nr:PAS domain-containing protein [Prevotella sp.]
MKIWVYHVDRQTFSWIDKDGRPCKTMKALEFARNYLHGDFTRVNEAFGRLINNQEEVVTLLIQDKDETDEKYETRYFSLELSLYRHANGKPYLIFGARRDITKEHQRINQEKDVLLRYQNIFDSSFVGLAIFAPDGSMLDVNEESARILRMTREELISKNHSLSSNFDDSIIEEAAKHEVNICTIAKLQPDQPPVYLEMQLKPVFDENGQLEYIFSTGRDMGEFVNAFHKLKEGTRQLNIVNKEITSYINNIDYILQVGGLRIIKYSPTTHDLTIFDGKHKELHTLTQVRCMTFVDDASKRVVTHTFKMLDNKTPNPITTNVKTTIRNKGTEVLYLQFDLLPVFDESGNLKSYFGICRDVSQTKWTEHLLAIETARAQEVESIKNAFLRNMSHEIRTPLNTVVGFAELFNEAASPEDEQVFIEEIKDNSAHLLRLINDILFLSRLDAKMIEINPKTTDFCKSFVNNCQRGWEEHQKEGVKLNIEQPYNQLFVDIDETQVGYVIRQIIENAAIYTDQGSINARYDYIDGKLFITIEDTGCGIKKENLPHIFERFVSGMNKGTGLELAICKELLQQMGGVISVYSDEGKGTSVVITLPCSAITIERKASL